MLLLLLLLLLRCIFLYLPVVVWAYVDTAVHVTCTYRPLSLWWCVVSPGASSSLVRNEGTTRYCTALHCTALHCRTYFKH